MVDLKLYLILTVTISTTIIFIVHLSIWWYCIRSSTNEPADNAAPRLSVGSSFGDQSSFNPSETVLESIEMRARNPEPSIPKPLAPA